MVIEFVAESEEDSELLMNVCMVDRYKRISQEGGREGRIDYFRRGGKGGGYLVYL